MWGIRKVALWFVASNPASFGLRSSADHLTCQAGLSDTMDTRASIFFQRQAGGLWPYIDIARSRIPCGTLTWGMHKVALWFKVSNPASFGLRTSADQLTCQAGLSDTMDTRVPNLAQRQAGG